PQPAAGGRPGGEHRAACAARQCRHGAGGGPGDETRRPARLSRPWAAQGRAGPEQPARAGSRTADTLIFRGEGAMVKQVIARIGAALGMALLLALGTAQAAEPLKIGLSMSLTGGLAGGGKSALLGMQVWAEDINAKGGLLGRPVQLVYYDDQS